MKSKLFVRETQVAAAAACRATDPGNFQLPSNQLWTSSSSWSSSWSSWSPDVYDHHHHGQHHQSIHLSSLSLFAPSRALYTLITSHLVFTQPKWPVSQLSVPVNRYCMLDTDDTTKTQCNNYHMADSTHVPKHPCASLFYISPLRLTWEMTQVA